MSVSLSVRAIILKGCGTSPYILSILSILVKLHNKTIPSATSDDSNRHV